MEPKAEFRTITPQEAKRLLASNTHNRNLKEQAIRRYMADLKAGRWKVNGEAVKIAADGTLLDGQNRCEASVRTGLPFTTLVVTGLDPETQSSMDQGVKRTNADALRLEHGYSNATAIAAAARTDHTWSEYGAESAFRQGGAYAMSGGQTLEWVETHPGIADAAETAKRVYGRCGGLLPAAHLAVLIQRFREIDETDADAFLEAFATGAGLDADSPILTVRRTLADMKGKRVDPRVRAAIMIKAWNKWRRGESCQRLGWQPGGSRHEAFPIPR
ncbi:hypothetical protein [Bifidobacterium sp. SO1]|uniref:hypothetical protein n=1 Tax=Bifidobacterium sp. SO1 TaxID=2809029 RepID=UPI001BDCFE1B|nr:hypothetical protein [Bifidobacterium sp. SO1]MBT1161690.1 hypothetical protein [Bifidobacterium sp. SO1]